MDITRCERWWLVTIPQPERVEIITQDGDHPPDRALAAVAYREGLAVDELHSSEARFRDGRVEVVVWFKE